MGNLTKALTAAAGNAGASLYVEDVFNTTVYSDTYAASTTNGIDLDGEGGMVWLKKRSAVTNHFLYDTDRGVNKALLSNSTNGESTIADSLTSFNSDGFSLGTYSNTNTGVAWSFRKAEKFFDVVTYTGDGNAATQINHSLNSTPGTIIVKKTSATGNWSVYHSYLGTGKYVRLEQYFADTTDADYFPAVTDAYFRPGSDNHVNESGQSFVAYLFASDAGGFGDDGAENIIKCGSYVGTGSATPVEVNVGFEPQFVIVKSVGVQNTATDWFIIDTMRGFTFEPNTNYEFKALRANESSAEAGQGRCGLTATGFVAGAGDATGASGSTYIYIAIRRPMKTPEAGTEVFNTIERTGTGAAATVTGVGFALDAVLGIAATTTSGDRLINDRLRGAGKQLLMNKTDVEATAATGYDYTGIDYMDGFSVGLDQYGKVNYSPASIVNYCFKRATGFFDVVAYTGTGVNPTTIKHNLGVPPELIICKSRTSAVNWHVGPMFIDPSNILYLDAVNGMGSDASNFTNTPATSTEFYVGNSGGTNPSSQTMVAYLFASVAGVSKVGSYTGTGSNVDVDCGFSAGARFILIKRTDSTGDWYVWDTERGIVAGNDPYLLMNSTVTGTTITDYIDPLSSGFTVPSSAPAALNASGGTYLFLAIA